METAEAARTRPSEPSEDVGEISRYAFPPGRCVSNRSHARRVLTSFPSLCGPPTDTAASRAHTVTCASISPPNVARDARDLVSPGVVCRASA